MRVRYDPNFHGTACLRGLWPFRTVVVGQWYMRQSPEACHAIFLHELAHAKLFHIETLLLLTLIWPPLWRAATRKRWRLEQEFSADRWVYERGLGMPLFQTLWRLDLENGFDEERAMRWARLRELLKVRTT